MSRLRWSLAVPVVALVGVLIALGPLPLRAEVYRWTDADGQLQYGDVPPPGVKAERVGRPVDPGLSPEAAQERLNQIRLDDAGRDAEREARARARAKSDAAAAAARAERARRCQAAWDALAALESQRPVYRDEEGGLRLKRGQGWPDTYSGERQYLDDATRASETARYRAEAQQNCEPDADAQAALQSADEGRRRQERCDAAQADLAALRRPEAHAAQRDLERQVERVEEECSGR